MNARCLPEAAPSLPQRHLLRSFDVFDTLIARRCIEPRRVFDKLEAQLGMPGFAAARIAAEQAVATGAYTLMDIYAELARRNHWSAAQAEQLAGCELQAELDEVIPVAQHLQQLDGESLLISDMYLSEAAVRALLRKAGLRQDLPLLLHAHGKSGGQVWRDLGTVGVQCVHLGDNPHSDVANARAAGMRARATVLTKPNRFEKGLIRCGLRPLAEAWRAARLSVAHDGLPDYLYALQTELNLPFLFVSALELLSHARETGAQRVLFSSRDGRHLQSMFDLLHGRLMPDSALRSSYWYTSRWARTSGDRQYLDYCRELFGKQPLVVDLCGTGTSLKALFADMRLDVAPPFYVAVKVINDDISRSQRGRYGLPGGDAADPLRFSFDNLSFLRNNRLEQLNYIPEGMVRGVRRVTGGWVPLREQPEFDAATVRLLQSQSDFVASFIEALDRELTPLLLTESMSRFGEVFKLLFEIVAASSAELQALEALFEDDDLTNENRLMGEMDMRCLQHALAGEAG